MATKPKIALVCDIRNWCFDHIATEIKNNLSQTFSFDIFYANDDYPSIPKLYQDLLCNNYDLVHFFWRLQLFNLLNFDVIRYTPPPFSATAISMAQTCLTTSVYDHAFLGPKETQFYESIYSCLSDAYTVSSNKLFQLYSNIPNYQPPDAIIQDGVNLLIFYPKNIQRFSHRKKSQHLTVGWVGNSKWALKKGMDNKGVETIIKPAILQLQQEGYNIISDFADRNKSFTPYKKMVDYYQKIDVLVCASDIEGTPNPVLEAMACGVPVVSTNVGIVDEVFGPLQTKFIFERNVESLKLKLKELLASPPILAQLSAENQKQIQPFTRSRESLKWKDFFKKALIRNHQKNTNQKLANISQHLLKSGLQKIDYLQKNIRLQKTIAHKLKVGLYLEKI